jgi:hypothetical protein
MTHLPQKRVYNFGIGRFIRECDGSYFDAGRVNVGTYRLHIRV